MRSPSPVRPLLLERSSPWLFVNQLDGERPQPRARAPGAAIRSRALDDPRPPGPYGRAPMARAQPRRRPPARRRPRRAQPSTNRNHSRISFACRNCFPLADGRRHDATPWRPIRAAALTIPSTRALHGRMSSIRLRGWPGVGPVVGSGRGVRLLLAAALGVLVILFTAAYALAAPAVTILAPVNDHAGVLTPGASRRPRRRGAGRPRRRSSPIQRAGGATRRS